MGKMNSFTLVQEIRLWRPDSGTKDGFDLNNRELGISFIGKMASLYWSSHQTCGTGTPACTIPFLLQLT